MSLCDCERSANGLGISGRECDCAADVEYGIDGDMWCAYRKSTFIDLAQSVAGFGATKEEAFADLLENEMK